MTEKTEDYEDDEDIENIGAENHVSVMYQAPSGFIIAMNCFNHEIWLILNGNILISIS